jgi:adenylosuccinate synthase
MYDVRLGGVMMRRIVVLSGPIASGKTSLGDLLVNNHDFIRLKTRELIAAHTQVAAERGLLQSAGDNLDQATGGKWVAEALGQKMSTLPNDIDVLVDSARIEPQIAAIRERFGARVVHVHLTAPPEELARRYALRAGAVKEFASYDEVRANQTEANVNGLAAIADIVVDTQRNTPEDIEVRVAGHLGLYGRSVERLVDVLVGGQYGSEGKGQVSAYLAREYDFLVRVGGPNAGHKVYEEPKPYTFHLLPSGTRASTARLVLGPGAVLSVEALLREIKDCEVTPERLSIDPQAMIIEESDISFEKGGLEHQIGSTAQGVGSATSRKVLRSAASPPVRLAGEVADLKPFIRETCAVLDGAFARGQRVFLEGTQGTALSLHHGHYPYVTSRDTTVSGCLAEAGVAPSRVRKIIAVCRTYPIRVTSPGGDSGPIGSEIQWDEVAQRSGDDLDALKKHEKTSTTNRPRRVAEFNWTLLRRTVTLNGPSDIALTFVDYLDVKNREARRFEQLTPDTIRFIEEVERVSAAAVSLIATRFHSRSIIDRRNW